MAVEELSDSITFLGTAGARFVVTKKFLVSGGAWFNLGGTEILFDPGPGCLVQATKRKLDPSKLDAIVLSHKHLDHSVDINIMIEAMTEGGWKRRGMVFAPSDAFGQGAVILPYLQNYPERIETLSEGGSYTVGYVTFETPIRHQHPVVLNKTTDNDIDAFFEIHLSRGPSSLKRVMIVTLRTLYKTLQLLLLRPTGLPACAFLPWLTICLQKQVTKT